MNEKIDGRIHRFSLGAMAMLVAISFTISLAAQPGKKARAQDGGTPKQTAAEKRDAEIYGKLAACWQSFYAGKYQEAAKQAEALTKIEARYKWVMSEAGWLQSRCFWNADNQQARARAQQMWKHLERVDTSNATKTRLQIAKAMVLEAEAQAPNVKPDVQSQKLKAAIDLLEPLLKERRWNVQEVEAALVLSNLYSNRAVGRFDDAKKTLQYIVSYLGDAKNITGMELPPGLEKSHIDAAKLAMKNLKYDASEGLAEFEAAEKLRAAGKFAEAQKAYLKITQDFPTSDFSPRSELHIGDCYAGLKQIPKAIDHWKRFITPLPAGPHRALAYLRIIDYSLEDALDITEAGKYAELCRASLPTALADEKTAPCWKANEYDLAVRVGLVSFITGKNEQAAEAWESAKKLTDKKTVQESLDALIAAAKSGKGVIPDDVKGSDSGEMKAAGATASPKEKCALILSMGVIHLVAGRLDNAEAMFDRILGTPAVPAKPGVPGQPARPAMQGTTPAQLAFATFGRGAIQQARNKPEEAKELFLASIKAFGDGTWHDESIFRVASIAQTVGDSKFGKAPELAGKPGQPAKPLTPAEKEAAAKADKERLAALLKAKGEALAYWQELIKRCPSSPRCEQAYYHAGVLLCDIAEASPPAQSEKLWKEAASMLSRFCESYPKSRMVGAAVVRHIDIGVERLLDLDTANQLVTAGETWLESSDIGDADDAVSETAPWMLRPRLQAEDIRLSRYQLCLRLGLVAYLSQNRDQAIKRFVTAESIAARLESPVDAGSATSGIKRLVEAVRAQKALTPDEAISKDDKNTTLIVQLADIYYSAKDYEKAASLYDRVLEKAVRVDAVQQSWAHYKRGRCWYCLPREQRDMTAALADYLAAQKLAPKAPWAYQCLFLAGNVRFNHERAVDQAIALWQQLLKEYPECPEAHRAAYYIGAALEFDKRVDDARKAYQVLTDKYPTSPFVELVKSYHLKELGKLEMAKPKPASAVRTLK